MTVRFRNRNLEWWLAATTAGLGMFIGLGDSSMSSPAYQQLLSWFSEEMWATFFTLTGVLHLIALAINGQAWWTPLVRSVMSAVNGTVFTLFAAGFYALNPDTTAVFSYSAFAVAAFVCFYKAAKDSVQALESRRNAFA